MFRIRQLLFSRWLPLTLFIIIVLATSVGFSAYAATTTVEWEDEFDAATLNERWFWLTEDQPWSLTDRPGYLRITIQPSGLTNHLVQLAPPGDFEIETKLSFTPTVNFQFAGLYVYEDGDNFMAFGRAYCSFCSGNAIYFDFIENGEFDQDNLATVFDPPGDTYLKIVREGTAYSGYISANGTDWTLVGTKNSALKHGYIGLLAVNQFDEGPSASADFDYFKLRDDSERLFLPLLSSAEANR